MRTVSLAVLVALGQSCSKYDDVVAVPDDVGVAATPAAGQFDGPVMTVVVQPDDKRVVGGAFAAWGGSSRPRIARLDPDGGLDASFATTGSGLDDTVRALAVDAAGRIVVGGLFNYYDATVRRYLARLNPDGSLDESFAASGSGFDSYLYALTVDDAGRIVAGGYFTSYDGAPRRGIARINPDATLDDTFVPGAGLDGNSSIYALAIDGAERILLGGEFTSYDGTPREGLARLNPDGSLDPGFVPPVGWFPSGQVEALAIDGAGRIVVSGGAPARVVRLFDDGTLDSAFTAPELVGDWANAAAIDAAGRIIVGGGFTGGLVRLQADGSLDPTFPTGVGFDAEVNAIALGASGEICAGGDFTHYGSAAVGYYVEL